jgi:molecular chaperone GrpE
MSDRDEKGAFQADIPATAIEEALRSVERVAEGSAGADEPPPAAEGLPVEVEAPAPAERDPGALAAEVERLRAELERATAKAREEHERLLRTAADLENYRKRAAREREEIQRFGVERIVKELLPVLDDLDRALAATPPGDPLAEGVRLVRASFERALARHGVVGFSALGEPFDPALHEALMQVPSADAAPGTVVLEHARGFKLNDRLVRPAMVGVAVAPPASST